MHPWLLIAALSGLFAQGADPACRSLSQTEKPIQAQGIWRRSPWDPRKLQYQDYYLSAKEYSGIRDAALRVREIAGDRPMLGVGRSPGPVTAFLSLLGRNGCADLAISGFRNRPHSPEIHFELPASVLGSKASTTPLTAGETTRLFEHFDKTIRAYLERHQNSRIALVDVGKTGASLFAMKRYLDLYAAARGLRVEFDAIVMTSPEYTNDVSAVARFYGVDVKQVVMPANEFIAETLKSSKWDSVAAFNSFDFHSTANGRTWAVDTFSGDVVDFGLGEPNPGHYRLRTAIQANMLTDVALVPYEGIPVLDLKVPGIRWDSKMRHYRDSGGNTVTISTGD